MRERNLRLGPYEVARRAQWRAPQDLTGAEAQANELTPRRFDAGNAELRDEDLPVEHVRRTAHSRPFAADAPGHRVAVLLARVEFDQRRQAVDGHNGNLLAMIEGQPTPVGAADIRGHDQRSAQARRREQALVPEARDLLAATTGSDSQVTEGMVDGDGRRSKRREECGEWLRRPAFLAGYVALRNRALLDREDRHSGRALEHEEHPGLVALDDDVNGPSFLVYGREERRGRVVVIPEIMMNGLKKPDHLPGGRAEGDDRVRVAILPLSLAAKVVRTRARRRQKDKVARRIGRHHAPGVCRARAVRVGAIPRDICRIGLALRHGIPRPRVCARLCVECAHLATRHVGAAVVRHSRADDDTVAHHDRRGGHLVVGHALWRVAQTHSQVDNAIGAEPGAELAGCRIQGEQSGVDAREKYPRRTRRGGGSRRVAPVADAATGVISEMNRRVHVRVEAPPLHTRRRVESEDSAHRRWEEMSLVARTLRETGVDPLMTEVIEKSHRRTVDAHIAPADGKVPALDEALKILSEKVVGGR